MYFPPDPDKESDYWWGMPLICPPTKAAMEYLHQSQSAMAMRCPRGTAIEASAEGFEREAESANQKGTSELYLGLQAGRFLMQSGQWDAPVYGVCQRKKRGADNPSPTWWASGRHPPNMNSGSTIGSLHADEGIWALNRGAVMPQIIGTPHQSSCELQDVRASVHSNQQVRHKVEKMLSQK